MSIARPKASIIILNWNSLNDTIECLESVKKLDYPNKEIIVVDNASTDGSPDMIKKIFPEITLIKNNENLGYSGGNNIGIKSALKKNAQYIWLLNNDTIVLPDTLSKLISSGENNPDVGLLNPVIYNYYDKKEIQYCGAFIDWQNYSVKPVGNINNINLLKDKEICLWGTALLIKRRVIEKIGLLNEKYFIYWEDNHYSLKAIRAGYINKIDFSAKIFHKCQYAEDQMKNKPSHYFYYMTRNEYWFWKENTYGFQKLTFNLYYLTKIVRKIAFLKKDSDNRRIDAYLDGLYSAFLNVGGRWDKRANMPGIIKRFILWHPHFLAILLSGNFKKNISEIFRHL